MRAVACHLLVACVVAAPAVLVSACSAETDGQGGLGCEPLDRLCSSDDVLICESDGSGYEYLRTCEFACYNGDCVDPPDGSDGGGGTAGEGGGGSTGDGGVGGGEPAGCGNDVLDPGEACDDGNLVNGDGCSRRCLVEPSGHLDTDEVYYGPEGSDEVSVQFSECDDETTTAAWVADEPLSVSVCAVSYQDSFGSGMSATEVNVDLDMAQAYFSEGGAAVELVIEHVDVLQGSAAQTDPIQGEIDDLLEGLREYADVAYPGECDVVIGYANSLNKSDGSTIGGKGTWPDHGIHTGVVSRGNAEATPGETAAHELGHVFGLYHTHQWPDDGCSDSDDDEKCSELDGCDVTCPSGSNPPSENVMSYYHCDTPNAGSFTDCQVRRMRCFISKMFPGPACQHPILEAPFDQTTRVVGEPIAFSWTSGDPTEDHHLRVRHLPPNGPLVVDQNVGTATSKTIAGSTFDEPGVYSWTVVYGGSCCPPEGCEAVERTFEMVTVDCIGASHESCGNCGTRQRECQDDGTWGQWSACSGQGACEPGIKKSCATGDQVTCTSECQYPACPSCECGSGACCDGCNYLGSNVVCEDVAETEYTCEGSGCGGAVIKRTRSRSCSGSSSSCTGSLGAWTEVIWDTCSSTETCAENDSSCNYTASCDCDCSSGVCCDGCNYAGSWVVCEEDAEVKYTCDGSGCGADVERETRDRYCSGSSSSCNGSLGSWSATTWDACSTSETCSTGDSSCNYTASCDCECSSGACCDGCNYKSASTICEYDADVAYDCNGSSCGADVVVSTIDRYCPGNGSSCNGAWGDWSDWSVHDSCNSAETCAEGDSTCNYSAACDCSASNYWSPSFDSDTDWSGKTATGSLSAGITTEVQQDGKGLEFRVCKEDGDFSEDIFFEIYDAADGSAGKTVSQLSTSGEQCSSWQGLNSDTGYDEGDTFGGIWRVVSPYWVADDWSNSCSPDPGAGGFCWNGINLTLTRTCKD